MLNACFEVDETETELRFGIDEPTDSEVPRLTHVLVLVPLSHSICLGKLTSQLHAVLARLGLRDGVFFFPPRAVFF